MKQKVLFFSLLASIIFSNIFCNTTQNIGNSINFESLFNPPYFTQDKIQDVFNQKVLKNPKIAVLKFFTTTCYPCKMTKRPFEILATQFSSKAEFFEVDAQKFQIISSGLQILKVPTFVCYINGEVKAKYEGPQGIIQLQSFLNNH